MIEKLTILHTNDLHSHFENWPRIQQYLKTKKNDSDKNVFLFDIGDHLDRFHPYTEATLGKGNVDMLNECSYDAVTIGNNEGITLANEDLMSLYNSATFDCVLANLYLNEGTRPDWAHPYKLYQSARGTKIGVIGVTIPYSNFYGPLNWKVTDPFEELRNWIPKVKEKSDVVIVLSHLGLSDDERMAEEFPDVDIILGGHTHHILQEGKRVKNSLLCCTGKYGQFVGKVDVLFDLDNRTVVDSYAKLYSTKDLPEVPNEADYEANLQVTGKEFLSLPVAYTEKDLHADWFQETELSQLLCSALTDWCKADCSFLNAGILVDGFKKGIITEFDIHKNCPHPINPCTIRLSGAELKEVLLQTQDDQYTSLELKGFGFRGKVFGKIVYDQIEFVGSGARAIIKINGEELHPEQIYTIATIDIFAFARFYPPLTRNEKSFFLPEFIRDILKWKLSEQFPLQQGPSF